VYDRRIRHRPKCVALVERPYSCSEILSGFSFDDERRLPPTDLFKSAGPSRTRGRNSRSLLLEFLGYAPVPEAVGRIVCKARITDGVPASTGGKRRIVVEHVINSESKGCASGQARPAGIVHFSRESFLSNWSLAVLGWRLLGIAGYRSLFNLRNEVGEIIGKLQVKSERFTNLVR